jgi:hypothetical protein
MSTNQDAGEFDYTVHLRGENRPVSVRATSMGIEDGVLVFWNHGALTGVFPLAGLAYAGRHKEEPEWS